MRGIHLSQSTCRSRRKVQENLLVVSNFRIEGFESSATCLLRVSVAKKFSCLGCVPRVETVVSDKPDTSYLVIAISG